MFTPPNASALKELDLGWSGTRERERESCNKESKREKERAIIEPVGKYRVKH